MQKQYQTILLHYIEEGGEPDLELAYEFGRRAINEGVSVLQVVDAHYEALADVLQRAATVQESITITQRAASLLKEALGPFEMTHRGYSETISMLRSQNEKLVQLIEERSRLLQQREDFMMVVTHDLKNPITAADRCLTLMLEGDFGELSPEMIDMLGAMKESNQRMFTMVKNLLEVYKYDQTTPMLNLKTMDVRSAIESIIKTFTLSAQMRNLTLDAVFIEEPHEVRADETAIQHVLTNLLDNAIKFTPQGGTITLSTLNSDSQVIIKVKDTGKGMSQEDLSRLFQRFFQSETGRRQLTGTGLGLYLCRQIINAHGGDIQCESELGLGTTFIVALPRATDHPENAN